MKTRRQNKGQKAPTGARRRGPSADMLQEQLDQRTRELAEVLEQKAATSEVLRIIGSSPGDLEPVFQTMLQHAVRICEAKCGSLFLSEGDAFRTVAQYGAPPAWDDVRQREPVFRPGPQNPLVRVASKEQAEHIADLRIDEAYVEGDSAILALVEIAGARTDLLVPLLKENTLIGIISIYRQEVWPFTDKLQLSTATNITKETHRMLKASNPKTVAPPAAMYSHSVEVPPNARWLYTAGQVGVRPDGTLPNSFEAQHDQIWRNTLSILADAGMGPEDIVRLNVYSTDPDGLKFVKSHREKYLKPGHVPASTWVVVSGLANPQWVVEMETIAAKA